MARASDPAARVAADLDRAGARWALVLDEFDEPDGRVSREHVEGGDGSVAGRSRPLAWVSVAGTLRDAFVAMTHGDAGWVALLDGSRYLGVLAPESLHAALRRSTPDTDHDTDQETDSDTDRGTAPDSAYAGPGAAQPDTGTPSGDGTPTVTT